LTRNRFAENRCAEEYFPRSGFYFAIAKTKKGNTAGMRLPGSIAKAKENKRM